MRVGDGDRAAFSALCDELVETVYGMSLSGGHDPSSAARISVDVFLCAWLRAGAYDPRAESAWTWVRAIAATTIAAQTQIPTRAVPPGTPTISAVEPEPRHV